MSLSGLKNAIDEKSGYVGISPTNTTLDKEALNAFDMVASPDSPDLVIELIDLYLKSSLQRIMTISKAAAEKQWSLLKQEAHTLKGSSSTLGVRDVAQMCLELEKACSCHPPEGVDALVQLLEYKFAKARQALTAERQRRLQQFF